MGTPGDKAKIGKVVTSEQSQLDSEERHLSEPSEPHSPSGQALSTTTTDMTITALPQFTFTSFEPTIPITATKPDTFHHITSPHLEQPQIDEFFSQTKYYPGLAESAPVDYPLSPPKAFKPFQDQAGPSGLQTPKTKTASSLQKIKKGKKPTGSSPRKIHSCGMCQKNFNSLEKLNKHQQTHTNGSPFKCDNCKKTFTSKFKLVRHSLIHSDRKPFSCTVCDRTFHRKDHLKNHFKVHSPSKKIYTCEKANCKKQYTSQLSYKKHQAVHAAEDGNLECQMCSQAFQTKEEILYHLKIHAGSRTVKNPNEKKFNCEHCGRKFFTKKDVRRHLVVHTGKRDFLCQFCPQRFGRKDHLVRHIKKSHHRQYQSENITTAIKSEISEPSTSSGVTVKSELDVKAELSESSLSNSQSFGSNLEFLEGAESIFEGDSLFPTDEPDDFKDLGNILEDISGQPSGSLLDSDVVLSGPEIQRLLQSSEDKNEPLPPFGKTFLPPPT